MPRSGSGTSIGMKTRHLWLGIWYTYRFLTSLIEWTKVVFFHRANSKLNKGAITNEEERKERKDKVRSIQTVKYVQSHWHPREYPQYVHERADLLQDSGCQPYIFHTHICRRCKFGWIRIWMKLVIDRQQVRRDKNAQWPDFGKKSHFVHVGDFSINDFAVKLNICKKDTKQNTA